MAAQKSRRILGFSPFQIAFLALLAGFLVCSLAAFGWYLASGEEPPRSAALPHPAQTSSRSPAPPATVSVPRLLPSATPRLFPSPTWVETVPPVPATFVPTVSLPQGMTILHQFGSQPENGRIPYGVLVFEAGVLYGTTTYGGPPYNVEPGNPANKGNLFRMNLDGSEFKVLHEFHGGDSDGWKPWSGLVISGDRLYGSTVYGGPQGEQGGVLYEIGLAGSGFRLLHAFGGPGDGYGASTSPILVGDSLYGMTRWGGRGVGIVYSYNLTRQTYTQLYRFPADGRDGSSPLGTLAAGNDGFLYGLAWKGGNYDYGTFFRLRLDGSGFEVLHHFTGGSQGKYPYDTPVFDGQETFYGTTLGEYGADPSDLGVVFKYHLPDQAYTVLHRFTGGSADSGKPNGGVVLSADGSLLYGTTHGDGAWGGREAGNLYQMRVDGSDYRQLYEFTGQLAGETPMRTPLLVDGALYGMTAYGGLENYGLIYAYRLLK
jgi:uncharacterized repeat protein (TIGR03803 family)